MGMVFGIWSPNEESFHGEVQRVARVFRGGGAICAARSNRAPTAEAMGQPMRRCY
jgi:hypothetical protein